MSPLPSVGLRRPVVSTTIDAFYSFFTPLTCWMWERLGMAPIVFLVGEGHEWASDPGGAVVLQQLKECPNTASVFVPHTRKQEFNPYLLGQMTRLYVGCVMPGDDLCLTSDVDMWPLHDTWFSNAPLAENILTLFYSNAYSGNLYKGKTHLRYPVCYMMARGRVFGEILGYQPGEDVEAAISRRLNSVYGEGTEERFKHFEGANYFQEEMLFGRLLAEWSGWPTRVENIPRPGSRHGHCGGRVDRGGWVYHGRNEAGLIDAHLPRPGHVRETNQWPQLRQLLADYLPGKLASADRYREEFCKAVGWRD